ncbi:MAG: uroporphyrinogen-III synthase [Paucibacter sp.]|nr:uroporphyrinogen-III synthase [Roseateles sp.]
MLILTRPREQAADWLARMDALGVQAQSLPLIGIEAGDGLAAKEAWSLLPKAALAMFVSPNAAAALFAVPHGRWPAHVLAACVGPGTARALLEAGVPAELIVQPPQGSPSLDSEHLWPLLAGRDWRDRLALMLRGEGGREWLAQRLQEQGAQTRDFNLYRRVCPSWAPAERAVFDEAISARHVWLLSSAEALGHLRTLAPEADWRRQRAIATHERIAAAARELGFGHVVLARPDAGEVAQAYRALWEGDPRIAPS